MGVPLYDTADSYTILLRKVFCHETAISIAGRLAAPSRNPGGVEAPSPRGRHDQMAEFDCQRDMDGFGMIPCVLADRYRKRLATLRRRGVKGIWAWPCESGAIARFTESSQTTGKLPKRCRNYAYPVTYFRGFTAWTEANVYLLGRFSWDTTTKPKEALGDWLSVRFGRAARGVLLNRLLDSQRVCQDIMYIDPYHRAAGQWSCNLPFLCVSLMFHYPYGWIVFTKDMNVYSMLADIYDSCRKNLQAQIDAPWRSHDALKRMQKTILAHESAFTRRDFTGLKAHIEHGLMMAELLAAYRESFLRYYRVAELLHGPIWTERGHRPGRFRPRRSLISAERAWPRELAAAKTALERLTDVLARYRRDYDIVETTQLDEYLAMADGFINVVWLE